jgi:hypothetical protein
MEIKMSSSDAMSPSHSNMVKNFITDAELTELLLFKYWHFIVTKFIAMVYILCLFTWHSAYADWVTSHKFWAFFENGLFEQPPNTTNLGWNYLCRSLSTNQPKLISKNTILPC